MAFLFVHSNSRVVQIALSAGLIWTVVMLKVEAMPYSCEMVFSSLIGFWNSIRCFLSSPLYICIAINFMVVLIAASSGFHRHQHNKHSDDDDDDHVEIVESPIVLSPQPSLPLDMFKTAPQPPPSLPQDIVKTAPQLPPQGVAEVAPSPPPPPTKTIRRKKPPRIITTSSVLYPGGSRTHDDSPRTCHDSTEHVNSTEKTNLYAAEALFNGALLSEVHEIKKSSSNSLDSSPALPVSTKDKKVIMDAPPPLQKGKEIHVEKEPEDTNNHLDDKENEEEDTLEATWNSIIGGGKQKPKKKELKKSETWNYVPPRRSTGSVQRLDSEELLPSTPKWRELRKSETFNDAVSITRRGGLRRDPSTSLEEFTKKVEAFIKKFNDNMRLQRQESNQRFLDMVNRGLYS